MEGGVSEHGKFQLQGSSCKLYYYKMDPEWSFLKTAYVQDVFSGSWNNRNCVEECGSNCFAGGGESKNLFIVNLFRHI